MLFGGRSRLDGVMYTRFAFSGAAHMLAVSGLHVGLIITSLIALLRVCRLKYGHIFCAVTPFLILYCVLCNFSPGVVRASIMAVCLMAARLAHRRYDGLSALSFASIVYLTVFPAEAVGTGYRLSYLAVFGILAFAPALLAASGRVAGLRRVPRKIRGLLAVTLAVQAATLPVTLGAFHMLAPYSLFVNMVLVPFMSAAFYLLFAGAALTAVLPFMAFVFAPLNLMTDIYVGIIGAVAALPFAAVTVIDAGVITLAALPALFIAGRFTVSAINRKILFAAPLILAVLVCLIAVNLPPPREYALHLLSRGVYDETLILDGDTRVFAGRIGGYNRAAVTRFLFSRRIRSLDAVYLTGYSPDEADALKSFTDTFKPADTYVPAHLDTMQNFAGLDAAAANSSRKRIIYPGESCMTGGIEFSYSAAVNGSGVRVVVFTLIRALGKTVVTAHTSSRDLVGECADFLPPNADLYIHRGAVPEGVSFEKEYIVPPWGEYNALYAQKRGAEAFTYEFKTGIINI
jgi:competence protein ComEC